MKKNGLSIEPMSCFKIPALSLTQMNLVKCHSAILFTHPKKDYAARFLMFDDKNIYDFEFAMPRKPETPLL
jgi:hypothetical protein